MEKKYLGITCPKILSHVWIFKLWKKFICTPKRFHLFEENICSDLNTIDSDQILEEHYLICRACGLTVYIQKIEE
jgi:hypothetical protein